MLRKFGQVLFGVVLLVGGSQVFAGPKKVRSIASGATVGSSGSTVIAGLSEKEMTTDIARIQGQKLIKEIPQGRISLVQVDNGGSTDVSSLMTGSTLYLGMWADGEMNNVKALYRIDGVNSYEIKKNDTKNSTVTLVLKCKNDRLKEISVESVVSYGKAEKDLLKVQPSGSDDEFADLVSISEIIRSKSCFKDLE